MQFPDDPGNLTHCVGFAAADVDVSADGIPHRIELRLGLVDHFHDLPGALAQQHPLRSQRNTVAAADEKLLPQFVFQILQLPRKRRLGNVERLGRAGDAALAGHAEKISQYSEFHHGLLSVADAIISPHHIMTQGRSICYFIGVN